MSKLTQRTLGEISNNFDNVRVPLSVMEREKLKKKYRYYGAQGVIDYVDAYLFDGEYILVAEDGENLKSQKNNICNFVTGKFWVNNHAHIINASNGHDTKYLYYKLSLVNFKNYVTGSAQPKLTKDNLNSIVLHIHKDGEQQKVAAVLSALDAKIDCNNRINAELEAMAKALYDYWFVQFDFPDAHGKPYKSSGGKTVYNATLKREIPEAWSNGTLADLISFEYGKSLKADIRTGNGYPVIGSNGVVDYHAEFLVTGPGIVVGRKGTVGAVTYLHDNFFPIDTTYYVKPVVDIEFIYLKYLLSSQGLEKMNSDSAVPGLNREAALRTAAAIPSVTLIKQFELKLTPAFKKLHEIEQENHLLAQLRDWLLPLLMNGQVTVA